jgi:diacylglycerol kinase
MERAFEFTGRIRSFKYAFAGIWVMLKTQHNAWIHFITTLGVIIAGFLLSLSNTEWCLIVLAIIAVWMSEALNTAFEFLADVTTPEYHPLVKKSKDVAAGSVLISVIGAIAIGIIVFGPKIYLLLF